MKIAVAETRRKFPPIPEPKPTLESLVQVCNALKEAVELLTSQRTRGQEHMAVPTWGDLAEAGLIEPDKIPKRYQIVK